jgi:hypothetical protein
MNVFVHDWMPLLEPDVHDLSFALRTCDFIENHHLSATKYRSISSNYIVPGVTVALAISNRIGDRAGAAGPRSAGIEIGHAGKPSCKR